MDISGDFLEAAEANGAAFTADAMAGYLRALAPGGVVSIPVSIREFPVYAVRVLATVREALRRTGALDPAAHVVVYRSAWNLRILFGPEPWTSERIAAVRKFSDERSFDVSYYPGMNVEAARAGIYNDLPAVNFASGEVSSSAGAQRLEVLPQAEVGQLVNVAVLAQATVIAIIVLAVPLFAPRVAGARAGRPAMLRPILYFASLGLGFLFIEIFLIEKASFYLNDRTSAFALVLTGMLVFSGCGSLLADRVQQVGIALSAVVVVGWCALALLGLEPLLLATLNLPWAVRAGIVLLLVAPVSLALGLPFPLGLARAGSVGGGFLPWAWSLNGAFSVIATPLANLIAVQSGFDRVLQVAALLYVVTFLAYPSVRKTHSWQPSPT